MGQELDLATWKDRQASEAIFRLKDQSPESEASRLLEMGPTNRVVTDREAKIMVALTVQAEALGPCYAWIKGFVNIVEEYQLTVGSPRNSRETFAAVLTQSLRNKEEKRVGFLDRIMGKFGGIDVED